MTEAELFASIDTLSALDLIEHLDKVYPERCIGAHDTLATAQRYAGRRDLINSLLMIRDATAP